MNFVREINRNIYSLLTNFSTLHTFNILWHHFMFSVRNDVGNKTHKFTPVHYQFPSPFIHHIASRLSLAGLPSTARESSEKQILYHASLPPQLYTHTSPSSFQKTLYMLVRIFHNHVHSMWLNSDRTVDTRLSYPRFDFRCDSRIIFFIVASVSA